MTDVRGLGARVVVPAACAIAVLVFAGCGSDGDQRAQAPPTATAGSPSPTVTALAGTPPDALLGTWKRRITAEDWHRAREEFSPGTWRLEIVRPGRVDVYLPGAHYVDFSARLATSGATLTIGRIPLCATVGLYSWQVSADRLTFVTLDDASCGPRSALFDGVWRRPRAG